MSRPFALAALVLTVAAALPAAALAQPVQPPSFLLPFDPAGAAINSMAQVPWAHHVRVDYATSSPTLASTLARTGDSLGSHWSKCQARYSSYNLVDDTYTDRDGVPRYCTF